jgi:hypothetical protein
MKNKLQKPDVSICILLQQRKQAVIACTSIVLQILVLGIYPFSISFQSTEEGGSRFIEDIDTYVNDRYGVKSQKV